MEIFENPKRILIIKLGALGDVMMAEGVMRCIRQHYSKSHITLMTEPLYARFMNKAPHFDEGSLTSVYRVGICLATRRQDALEVRKL